tara:strand:- start:1894 stop:2190 length:297 start_codon:yes stop_codon:yes gene_type:complete
MSVGSLTLPRYANVVGVKTTSNRGFTPEELSEECVKKILSVSDSAHPAIREQAHDFSVAVQKTVVEYMRQAIRSDRTTVYNALNDAGHPDLAELIRRL